MPPVTPTTVVYDACVLYPAPLRDLLVRLAMTGLVYARWSDQIHDEWTRNLLANRPDLTAARLRRTRGLMNHHVRDSLVTGYETLIPTLSLPDPDDRHVLAVALHAKASTIVTFNLADFPTDYLGTVGVQPRNPDDFVLQLLDDDPSLVCSAIAKQRRGLTHLSVTVDELLTTVVQQQLPRTVERLRPMAHLL